MNFSHDETGKTAEPGKTMPSYPKGLPGEKDFPHAAPGPIDGTVAQSQLEEPHIGQALRSAYQAMVDEAIPEEMLDLLNKLD